MRSETGKLTEAKDAKKRGREEVKEIVIEEIKQVLLVIGQEVVRLSQSQINDLIRHRMKRLALRKPKIKGYLL